MENDGDTDGEGKESEEDEEEGEEEEEREREEGGPSGTDVTDTEGEGNKDGKNSGKKKTGGGFADDIANNETWRPPPEPEMEIPELNIP